MSRETSANLFARARKRWHRIGGIMPLYIPPQGRHLLGLLAFGETKSLTNELYRLSSLGSPWASALLGWLCLIPDRGGVRQVERAIGLCRAHAYAGDPYSCYVLAWAWVCVGRKEEAFPMMERAAAAGFPPASVDLITFLWPNLEESPQLAAELLGRADRSGHMAAMLWRCRLYKTGNLGIVRRMLGHLMMPVALGRAFWGFWKGPFSSETLLFQNWMTKPAVLEGGMNESMNSERNIDPRLAFDRKALMVCYAIFSLCAVFTFIGRIDLSAAAYPGYTSGIAVLMIASPSLIPYALSGAAAWQLMSKQWQLMLKHRRLRLYLLLLVIAIGTLFSSLLMLGVFAVSLTRLMLVGLLIAETVVYLGAAGFFLSENEWHSP